MKSRTSALKALLEVAFVVASLLSLIPGYLAARKLNSKANADVRSSYAQQRVATALERIADVLDGRPMSADERALLEQTKILNPKAKPRVTNKSILPECLALTPIWGQAVALPDSVCEAETVAKRCWDGNGESVWITPAGCVEWYYTKNTGTKPTPTSP